MKHLYFLLVLWCMGSMTLSAQTTIDNDILNADLERLIKQRRAVHSGDLEKGLVLYLPFNSDCKDASNMGNNGQLKGSAGFANCELGGQANTCLSLGGVNNPGCVRVPNSSSLSISDGWTFATFVRITSLVSMDGWGRTKNNRGGGAIFAKSHDRSGFVIFCGLENNKFSTSMGGSISGVGGSIEGVNVNEWIHVAYTYANGEFKLYLNGKLITTKAMRPNFGSGNNQDMYLGKFSDSWYPLHAYMDEVRIYNRGLSAGEVEELAQK